MEYIIVNARLEDLTNVVVTGGGRSAPRTSFNATIEGKRYYGLDIGGRLNLKSGMTVTAALRRTNDWYSLAGWKNIESGKIEGITPPEFSLFSAFLIFITGALTLHAFYDGGDLTLLNIVFIAVLWMVAAGMAVGSRRAWIIQKRLRSCSTDSIGVR